MACSHCIAWFASGRSVCPTCRGQHNAHLEERRSLPRWIAPSPRDRSLTARGIYPPAVLTEDPTLDRRIVQTRRPNRLAVFRLTGLYFPEPVAAEMLEEIERHRWLEAERLGRDIWAERDPENPHRAAVSDWIRRFFQPWRDHASRQPCHAC